MAWNLSTGMTKALLGANPSSNVGLTANTISFGDGDGTGSTDTINDSGSGLAIFKKHAWVLVLNYSGTNHNMLVKAITSAAGKLEVVAGSFATESAGSYVTLVSLASGSVEQILQNGTIDIYSGSRPADADTTESGTKLLPITLDGGTFVAGEATNGINLGAFSGTTLKRAVDPETATTEIWRGAGVATDTAGWCRWYDNAKTTGASTTANRMDGVVAVSGGDLNMVNGVSIVTDIYSEVSDVNMTMTTA